VPYDQAYDEGFEDMPRRIPDTSKVADLIGFRPRLCLDDILRIVIDFHSSGSNDTSISASSGVSK